MKNLFYLFILFILVFISSCKKDDVILKTNVSTPAISYDGAFVRAYIDLTCKIVKNTKGFFPPQASRAYGYIGVATYESVVPGIQSNATLQGQINGLNPGTLPAADPTKEYNWAISANAAVAEMIRKMFEINIDPANLAELNTMEATNFQNLSAGIANDVVARSTDFGKGVATALYEFSKTDGGHQSFLNPFQLPYTLPTGPDQWVPTGAAKSPVSPKWGTNRAFINSNVANTDPPPCYNFSTDSSSDIYKDAYSVYVQVKNNTPEQINITKFWADDPFNTCTPTGHTVNILTSILGDQHANLAKTSVAYGKIGVCEYDAFIACWKCKYKSNRLRPFTYIRQYIDPTFNTVIGTPPFPAYVSGHSVEIGAAERVFTNLFTNGDGNFNISDRSQLQYGFPVRTWSNFDAMAQECANSRFYGGIHFQQDNQYGLEQGKKIGDNVNTMLRWAVVN